MNFEMFYKLPSGDPLRGGPGSPREQPHSLKQTGSRIMEEAKQRVIQEYVPGRQITLAHLIASPQRDIPLKLGLDESATDAIGILTITPSEGVIIAADIATKAADVQIGFLDRFGGSLLLTGDVASVEAGLREVLRYFGDVLHYALTDCTRS